MGDTLGDPVMADGVSYIKDIIKIGFLNKDVRYPWLLLVSVNTIAYCWELKSSFQWLVGAWEKKDIFQFSFWGIEALEMVKQSVFFLRN